MYAVSTSPYVVVGGGTMPYIGANSNNPMQGMIRFNGNSMETFNGTHWTAVNTTIGVGLSLDAIHAIDWAKERMQQEKEWTQLAEKNKAVQIALDSLQQAKNHLAVTASLAREYETTN